jgi:hypothetical protein
MSPLPVMEAFPAMPHAEPVGWRSQNPLALPATLANRNRSPGVRPRARMGRVRTSLLLD